MNDIEFRKIQEAMANLLKTKNEIAEGTYSMFQAYKKAGFKEKQALKLIIAMLFGNGVQK